MPVTTRSPSFKPSTTSVVMPSLIPVFTVTAVGFDAPEASTKTVRSVRRSARFPPGLFPPPRSRGPDDGSRRGAAVGVWSGGRKRRALFGIFNVSSRCAVTMETFAVIPGFNFCSGLLTPITVS